MKLGDEGGTYLSLPPNLQTGENRALGYAVDRQMKKLTAFCEKISVWSDIDNVPSQYYDYLAASLRAPYYSSEDDDATKLLVLKQTLRTYMFAGSTKAIEELVEKIFQGAEVIPWYEYDGTAYHFKVKTSAGQSEEAFAEFSAILKRIKAQRSILDAIESERQAYGTIYTGGIALGAAKPSAIIEGYSTKSSVTLVEIPTVGGMPYTKMPVIREEYSTESSAAFMIYAGIGNRLYERPPVIMDGYSTENEAGASLYTAAAGVAYGRPEAITEGLNYTASDIEAATTAGIGAVSIYRNTAIITE